MFKRIEASWGSSLLLTVLLLFHSHCSLAAPSIDVGVVVDEGLPNGAELLEEIETQWTLLSQGEFELDFSRNIRRLSRAKTSRVARTAVLDALLSDRDVGVILLLGVASAYEASCREGLSKPVIAPLMLPDIVSNAPENLNYIESLPSLERSMNMLSMLAPFDTAAIMVDPESLETIAPWREHLSMLQRRAEPMVYPIPLESDPQQWLAKLPRSVDAIFLSPLARIDGSEITPFAESLLDKGLASFSARAVEDVAQGLLAGLRGLQKKRLARRVALNLRRTLLDEAPHELPISFARKDPMTINMETLRALGLRPRRELLADAELMEAQEQSPMEPKDLPEAIELALRANLDLAAARREIQSREAELEQLRANRNAKLDFSLQGRRIDGDRAQFSFGLMPQEALEGSMTLTKILYSQKLDSKVDFSRRMLRAKMQDLKSQGLDIVLNTAKAYLGLLRLQSLEQIQRFELDTTRANHRRARVRVRLGEAGAEELHRWESELAMAKERVFDAVAKKRQASLRLKRMLHRPMERALRVRPLGLDSSFLHLKYGIEDYYGRPEAAARLADFFVEEGLRESPKLQEIELSINAKLQLLRFLSKAPKPTIAFRGKASRWLSSSGGSDCLNSIGDGFLPFPDVDDEQWSVGVSFNLPLSTGGSRLAERRKLRRVLESLRLKEMALGERIEERVRAAVFAASASYSSIGLSEDAAAAARKNLELLTAAYERGAASVVELIDAQRAAFTARERASAAVYAFLQDLMELERAVGVFDLTMTPEDLEQWCSRMRTAVEGRREGQTRERQTREGQTRERQMREGQTRERQTRERQTR